MVESLDVVFHALSSEPRRDLLGALAAVSKHLKVLELAGLVERRVDGRTTICRLRPEPLTEAREWVVFIEQFWSTRLDRLEKLLTEGDA